MAHLFLAMRGAFCRIDSVKKIVMFHNVLQEPVMCNDRTYTTE